MFPPGGTVPPRAVVASAEFNLMDLGPANSGMSDRYCAEKTTPTFAAPDNAAKQVHALDALWAKDGNLIHVRTFRLRHGAP